MTQYKTTIGIEIHVQLSTESKLFSTSATTFNAPPNSQANLIDVAIPGTLPVINQKAVALAVLFGYAVDADINPVSEFARKNYFYPDLPKGYQISQHLHPIVSNGQIRISDTKTIQIERAHLEEDAGKSIHDQDPTHSLIDLNRAGTPLLEIVTTPCMHSSEEALTYLKKIHKLVRYLDISDANMQEGSFRADINISIAPQDSNTLGTRTEIKNLNSFRFIEQAIHYETKRHQRILEKGETIQQETRLYDPNTQTTSPMRSKEDAHDYRYFPDPDLPPLFLNEVFLTSVKNKLPTLPDKRKQTFLSDYALSEEDAEQLTDTQALADYFESIAKTLKKPKSAANWILVEPEARQLPATILAELLQLIEAGTISGKIAKQILPTLISDPGITNIKQYVEAQGLIQLDDDETLHQLIDKLIQTNAQTFESLVNGQMKLMGFFVGQVMKATSGKANPGKVNQLLNEKIRSFKS